MNRTNSNRYESFPQRIALQFCNPDTNFQFRSLSRSGETDGFLVIREIDVLSRRWNRAGEMTHLGP